MESGSLPPGFPATTIDDRPCWDGGIIDNTPLGDAIDGFSGSDDSDRILIVMNLFRKNRALPTNMIEVNDRLNELRFGNRVRQDSGNARAINELLQTIEDLATVTPAELIDLQLEARIFGARRFRILDAVTNIDLADPDLMAEAGFPLESPDPNAFRDFSVAGIDHRRDIGYGIAQIKLRELFAARGFMPTPAAGKRAVSPDGVAAMGNL
jgi:hypothetical protein